MQPNSYIRNDLAKQEMENNKYLPQEQQREIGLRRDSDQ